MIVTGNVKIKEKVLQVNGMKGKWHERLGHVSYSTIEDMKKRKIIEGLVFTESKVEKCEACIKGKMKKKSL